MYAASLPRCDVEHETRIAQRRRPDAQRRSDVERFEDRVNGDAVSIRDDIRESDRHAIHHNQLDFRVGNAAALDEILSLPGTTKERSRVLYCESGGRWSFNSA